MIYMVHDVVNVPVFVCTDQSSMDMVLAEGTDEKCIIGTQDDANNLLSLHQTYFLESRSSLFHVHKEESVPGGYQWNQVDLNKEPDNTDCIYQVFEPIDGRYIQAIGLTEAKNTVLQVQQENFLRHGLDSVKIFESWPMTSYKPKNKQPTTGTQTL